MLFFRSNKIFGVFLAQLIYYVTETIISQSDISVLNNPNQ